MFAKYLMTLISPESYTQYNCPKRFNLIIDIKCNEVVFEKNVPNPKRAMFSVTTLY